jgi:hypothetical protein
MLCGMRVAWILEHSPICASAISPVLSDGVEGMNVMPEGEAVVVTRILSLFQRHLRSHYEEMSSHISDKWLYKARRPSIRECLVAN